MIPVIVHYAEEKGRQSDESQIGGSSKHIEKQKKSTINSGKVKRIFYSAQLDSPGQHKEIGDIKKQGAYNTEDVEVAENSDIGRIKIFIVSEVSVVPLIA